MIKHKLQSEGLDCDVTLVTGKKAFESKFNQEIYDLVLLDFNLPDYDGMSALKYARRKRSETPIIIISGTIGEEGAVECLKAGANDYVLKQGLQRLGVAVRRALKEKAEYTARREAEIIAGNEKLFSDTMIESLPGIFYFFNDQGKFLRWNRNFGIISGYSDEEIARMHPLDFFLDGEKQLVAQRIGMVFEKGDSTVEASFVAKSGKLTPYFFTGRKVIYNGLQCLVGIGVDVAERKLAEHELRIAATAFEAQEGMMVTDANQIILRVNSSFTKITGYMPDEVIGKTPAVLSSGQHDAEFFKNMWKSLKTDSYWHGEIWNRRKNGDVYPEWLNISAVSDADGKITHYVGSFFDVTKSKAAEEKIEHLAFYDSLTSLPNRVLLRDRLQHTYAASARYPNHYALLFVDIDNFKILNDTKGHNFGDLLLVEVASRLQASIREIDTVARLGGDEFVVLLEKLSTNAQEAAAMSEVVGEKILYSLSQPFWLDGYEHHSSASIGISLFRKQEVSVDELLKRSDTAMYQAKAAGRNTLRFYDPAMQELLEIRTLLERDLRRALAENQFQLYYQMQVYHNGHIL
ncbi:MAG TPA: diguanylate cyclase, partial [Methylobacter sp.]